MENKMRGNKGLVGGTIAVLLIIGLVIGGKSLISTFGHNPWGFIPQQWVGHNPWG